MPPYFFRVIQKISFAIPAQRKKTPRKITALFIILDKLARL
jgi:hypothetical protein